MTIEKLRSGSYRITQMYNGKRYRKTVPFKPTRKEAIQIMAEVFEAAEKDSTDGYSVEAYLLQYLDDCRHRKRALSPSTIKNYGSIIRNVSPRFKALRFHDVTEDDIRNELNRYKETHSNKSVSNMKGYLKLVFASYRPHFIWSYSIQKAEPKAEYEPTTEDIQRILKEVAGSKYEIPLRLAALGLRRGEICALKASDLSDSDILSINKAVVLDEDYNHVIKEPKTQASNRRIKIPHSLAELIRERDYSYEGNFEMINRCLHRLQDKLGIPRFKLHMMRHFAVAYLHKEGFTAEQIMAYGGWSTDSVMRRAYRYNLDPEESMKNIADKFSAFM